MKLLIDTNIILDVLLKRDPFCELGVKVMNLVGKDDVQEYVSASAITDIYYIAYRMLKDKQTVIDLIKRILQVVSIVSVSEQEINMALALEWNDFEDSVQYSAAMLNEMDGLVTRNPNDYKQSRLPIWLPEQILDKLK